MAAVRAAAPVQVHHHPVQRVRRVALTLVRRIPRHVRPQVQRQWELDKLCNLGEPAHRVSLERDDQHVGRYVDLCPFLRADVRRAPAALVLVATVQRLRVQKVGLEGRFDPRGRLGGDLHRDVNHGLVVSAHVSALAALHLPARVPAEDVVHDRRLLRPRVQYLLRVFPRELLERLDVYAVEHAPDVLVRVLLPSADEVLRDASDGVREFADGEGPARLRVQRLEHVLLVLARHAEPRHVAPLRRVGLVREVRGEQAGVVKALQRGRREARVAAVGEARG